jgi:thiamine biosynthesis lipoprotein
LHAWRVGIQHPRNEQAWAMIAHLSNRCLATSGDYETSFTEDYSAHHIIDPRCGTSPTELASVSVLAPTAMLADSLSTAIFVLGPRQGLELAQQFRNVDLMMIDKRGRVQATSGFAGV